MSRRTLASLGVIFAVAVFSLPIVHVLAMTSTNFGINWDSVNSGGDDVSSSTNFGLRDTIGEQATGFSTSTNYGISAGYRVGDSDTPFLSFHMGTQENSTQTPYTAFDNALKTVTVASTANFSVGDLIGVVENLGLSQTIALGRVVSIVGSTITVDSWDGSPALLSPVPSGGDDFVYRMDQNAADLGALSVTSGKTSLTGTRVTTNAANGYTVYVNDDGDLRSSPTSTIANVSDGSVTVGSEEYGAVVFGATATSTGSDFAFSTTTRAIQTSTSTSAVEQRVGLVYKAAIDAGTAVGVYSQAVFYTVTANY